MFCICLTCKWHTILDVLFAKHTNRSNEAMRFLKTDLHLSSSLLEIDFPTFLLLFLEVLKKVIPIKKKSNKKFIFPFFEKLKSNMKNVEKSNWSRLDDKWKSIFRIIIASPVSIGMFSKAHVQNTMSHVC